MPSPLDVEQKFRNLAYLLSYPSTSIHRLRLIADFFRFLGSDIALYESYPLELAERLSTILHDLNAGGNDPDHLQSIYETLRFADDAISSLKTVPGFTHALRTLQDRLVESALFAGDLATAVALLDASGDVSAPAWIEPVLVSDGDEETLLLKAIAAALKDAPDIARRLEQYSNNWKRIRTDESGNVYFPAVESAYIAEDGGEKHGILRTARVEITGTAKGGNDHIHTDAAFFGVEPMLSSLTRTPVTAARTLFQTNLPRSKASHFSGHIHLNPQSALHEGNSANLVVAALFYTTLLDHTNQRVRYRIRPTVAMTGDVSETGSIIPVDEDSLRVKAKAVFFSHIDTFVVPREQANAANDLITELTHRYPHRSIDVIGISHLREVFYDLRVIEQRIIPPLAHIARFVWQHRVPAGLLSVVGILIIVLVRILYGPIDRNPVSAEWLGEEMSVKNVHGEVIKVIRVGEPTCRWALERSIAGPSGLPVSFVDCDRDGINEIVYVEKAQSDSGSSDKIICTAIGRDHPLWTKSSTRILDFQQKIEARSGDFLFGNILGEDLDGDGACEIIVISNSRSSFPGLILEFDARDGHERGCYLNIGHINFIAAVDIDGDGRKEILACGFNNAYRNASMLIIDPRRLNGHSPTRGNYIPGTIPRAAEEIYIMFPRTILGEQFEDQSSISVPQFIEVLADQGKYSVTIDDVCAPKQGAPGAIEAHIKYTFSNASVLTGIDRADDYDRLGRNLYKEGKIGFVPDDEYFKGYSKKILMWDNNRFTSISALGKNGLDSP